MKKIFLLILSFSLVFAYVGKVKEIKGHVGVMHNAKVLPLKKDSKIFKDDVIFTGKDGKVKIIFKDHTIITIGKNSKFKIKEYLFSNKNPKATFRFFKGTFKSITGKIGKIAPKRFKLKTNTATIGIRGTTVVGIITATKETIGCTSGKIVVISDITGKALALSAGMMTTAVSGILSNPMPLSTAVLGALGAMGIATSALNILKIPFHKDNKNKIIKINELNKTDSNETNITDLNITDINSTDNNETNLTDLNNTTELNITEKNKTISQNINFPWEEWNKEMDIKNQFINKNHQINIDFDLIRDKYLRK